VHTCTHKLRERERERERGYGCILEDLGGFGTQVSNNLFIIKLKVPHVSF